MLFAKATSNFTLENIAVDEHTISWLTVFAIAVMVVPLIGFWFYYVYCKWTRKEPKKETREEKIDKLVRELDNLKKKETALRDKLNRL